MTVTTGNKERGRSILEERLFKGTIVQDVVNYLLLGECTMVLAKNDSKNARIAVEYCNCLFYKGLLE